MPFSVKSPAERLRRREENGLRVKGTGVGQRVKGKEDERQLKARCVLLPRERMGRRRWRGGRRMRMMVDGSLTRIQTREEETGYVGDAADDPDLEGGSYRPPAPEGPPTQLEAYTNQHHREDMDVDGRSGQNKRIAHVYRVGKRNCTTCHQHLTKGVHSNSREEGVILGSKLWLDVYSTNRRVCDHECVSIVKLWM